MFFKWIHEKHGNVVLLKPMYSGLLGKTKGILLHNMFSCRSSTQWFCTNTFWYRLIRQNNGCFHSFNQKPVQKHFVPSQLSKTQGRQYTSQCSTARRTSNPSKPTILGTGSPWFQGWEAWVPTLGNLQLLDMGTHGSKVVGAWVLTFGNGRFFETQTQSCSGPLRKTKRYSGYTKFSCRSNQHMFFSFRPTKQNKANPYTQLFFMSLQKAPVMRKHMLIKRKTNASRSA